MRKALCGPSEGGEMNWEREKKRNTRESFTAGGEKTKKSPEATPPPPKKTAFTASLRPAATFDVRGRGEGGNSSDKEVRRGGKTENPKGIESNENLGRALRG